MHSKMKFTIFVMMYVLNALWNLGMVSSEDNLRAVSSSADLGKFYLEMNRLHSTPKSGYDSEKNTQAVCHDILKSALFFYVHEVRPVSFNDEWVQGQLTIHADQYPKLLCKNFSGGEVTPYMEETIKYLDENIQEYVFPCAAKKRRSEDLKIYFVSHKYDLGCMVETELRKKRNHMGRFVFECNAKEERLNLIALAENSIELADFELAKRERVRKSFLIDDEQRNLLCNYMTALEKLRVCSMALNARDYRGVILFLSRDEDVQPQCENVDLVYRFLDGHDVLEDIYFNVLAFKCLAKSVGQETTASAEIFISVGNGKHTFFISSQEGNRTIIKKYFYSYNISPPKRL